MKSAGFYPKSGRRSAEDYIRLAGECGVDLSNHQSTVLDNCLLDWADVVIIMDGKNYKLSLLKSRDVESKLVWLGSLDDKQQVEIRDPYSKSISEQIEIISQMQGCCNSLIDVLKSNSKTQKSLLNH